MSDVFHRNFFINGPVGRLEAMLWTSPDPNPSIVAVMCHPHPLFGGTMHNKVVFQAAKAIHKHGIPVLRFNFRGAGFSEGVHDEGRGETGDVRAAIDYLASTFPNKPILLGGFSFGSRVGLQVGCDDSRVARLIGIGIPVNTWDFSFLQSCGKPKLFVQGAEDQFGARNRVEEVYETLPEPKQLVFVEGADHFFAGKLDQLAGAIDTWLQTGVPAVTDPARVRHPQER